MTSRREDVDGVFPDRVTTAVMERMIVPAVGKVGLPSWIGMMRPVIVSPAVRNDVKATLSFTPFVDSVPADLPATVRCVLPEARPATVKSLEAFTVLVSFPSW
jgi:hypothetical protein